mmetsp:Transcript_54019/g.121389  ORF Transcript_54019/g.121389 Transcript_54019/m.121389 type:complete len:136 (-) Transcript_54019:78-485(-)
MARQIYSDQAAASYWQEQTGAAATQHDLEIVRALTKELPRGRAVSAASLAQMTSPNYPAQRADNVVHAYVPSLLPSRDQGTSLQGSPSLPLAQVAPLSVEDSLVAPETPLFLAKGASKAMQHPYWRMSSLHLACH